MSIKQILSENVMDECKLVTNITRSISGKFTPNLRVWIAEYTACIPIDVRKLYYTKIGVRIETPDKYLYANLSAISYFPVFHHAPPPMFNIGYLYRVTVYENHRKRYV